MGWRFQKRIKLLPGITLNLSRSGISTSLGAQGARITYGRGRQRVTLGAPGTGLSHTTTRPARTRAVWPLILAAVIVAALLLS